LVEEFTAALEGLKGHVRRVPTAADAAAAVLEIAEAHGATKCLSWDEDALCCPGVLAFLASRGVRRVRYEVHSDAVRRRQTMDALGGVGLGLTGADAALADTGALVLTAGPGRGRLVSLLPPVHVAIVPVDRLVPSLGALFAARPGLLDESSNVVAIAGPSRTADIEMTLTHGVHGPKRVYAVLVG
jgi:L-lactate dehydrogenase complex protein LldG